MNDTLKPEETPTPVRQPQQTRKETYVPPTIEVIEVKTEAGYAASGSNFGNGGRW